MNTSEFDKEFLEEVEKRIEIISNADTPDKRLSSIDYILIGIISIMAIFLLLFGRIL
ncbi:hypothetical protein J6TS1_09950 [Siminovitchia terrae]|uniref:Uncharacterized protein n=1 Tax=Siminovitchia terrae TaxID=1914933 RepID=A0ABQ4KSV3_SIMTE|nr:hypothetical protein [Siminovitchia terrae]GIN95125.1 hypothetical protein J6TS1_09950 [Siminovitchia terrae]